MLIRIILAPIQIGAAFAADLLYRIEPRIRDAADMLAIVALGARPQPDVSSDVQIGRAHV